MDSPDLILKNLLDHEAWIKALARRLVDDAHDADDIAQDALVAAMQEPPNAIRRLRPWLGGLVRNLSVRRRRDASNRVHRESAAASRDQLPSVLEMQEREETRSKVAQAVFSLDEPYRSAVLYRYFEDLPPREIAKRLAVSVTAVEGRLRRGLQKLRARLDRDFGDRKTWCVALVPLAGLTAGEATAATAATAGAVIMGMKMKIGIAVIAAMAVGYAWMTVQKPAAPAGRSAAATAHPHPESPGPDMPRSGLGSASGRDATSQDSTSKSVSTVAGPVLKERTVTGTVHTAAGLPVKNAQVRAFTRISVLRRGLQPFEAHSRTDGHGRFSFGYIEPVHRIVLVEVAAQGFHRDMKTVAVGESVAFVLGLPGTLRGRVTLAGEETPCAGTIVGLWKPGVAAPSTAVTDADGFYRFKSVKPDTYHVLVETKDQPTRSPPISVVIRPGRETVGNIEVKRGLVLRGRVVEAETRVPVQGARITTPWSRPKHEAVADEQGRFTLGPLGERTPLRITADGFVTKDQSLASEPRDQSRGEKEEEFVLTRAASIQGRVLDPDGVPVSGARVQTPILAAYQRVQAESGEDGRFRLKCVPVGVEVRLIARKDGLARALSDALFLRTGESRFDLVLRLGRGAVVSGRLADTHGSPVTRGRIHLKPRSRRLTRQHSASPDKSGNFRIEAVPAGRYSLEVWVKGLVGQRRPDFLVEEGGQYSGIDFVLAQGLPLTGVVVDQTNQPVRAATVAAYPVSPRVDQIRSMKSDRTDATGRFTLTGLDPGAFTLSIRKQGYHQENPATPFEVGSHNVVVKLIKLHDGIGGNVLRQDTGTPVPRFFVRCYHGPKSFVREFTDQDGRFELTGLVPGLYFLEAGTEDGSISSQVVRVEVRDGSGPVQVELLVSPGISLSGRVNSPDGTPLDRARVEVCRATGKPTGVMSCTQADSLGKFEIRSLIPGEYRIRASHMDWFEVEQIVTVRRGQPDTVVLQVGDRGGTFEITARDPDGNPVEGARLVVTRPDGFVVELDTVKYGRLDQERRKASPDLDYRTFEHKQHRTNDQGVIERQFLPAGRYELEVSRAGYRTAHLAAEAEAGVTTRLTVTLVPEK